MTRDNISINKSNFCIGHQCESCGSSKHFFMQCPYVHYSPRKYFVIRRFIQEQQRQRKDYSRREFRFDNALLAQSVVK